ncbi:MAG: CoA transferase [Acidimicrobiales bacterium]
MATSSDRRAPAAVAVSHVQELLDACGVGFGRIDIDRIAEARPAWPVWPQVALESLVGPPERRLSSIDLRWLHRLEAVVGVVDELTARLGGPRGGPTALSLVVERAQMMGLVGGGTVSAGGATRMVRAGDGWVAASLPRPDDLRSVDALVGRPVGDAGNDNTPWEVLRSHASGMTVRELELNAELLGMAVTGVAAGWDADDQRAARGTEAPVPYLVSRSREWSVEGVPLVVDLTSLWAGPLLGWYLGRAGAHVVKIESRDRPDGARQGQPGFWRRLNATKQVVELDMGSAVGQAELRGWVERADIVLEASRPRAMQGFGIQPGDHIEAGGIWCSITGYGRTGPWSNRVAFGDDAAAAGGLTTFVDGEPWFIGDATADPIAGVTATAGVLALWNESSGGMVDVAMRDAVAHLTRGGPVESHA